MYDPVCLRHCLCIWRHSCLCKCETPLYVWDTVCICDTHPCVWNPFCLKDIMWYTPACMKHPSLCDTSSSACISATPSWVHNLPHVCVWLQYACELHLCETPLCMWHPGLCDTSVYVRDALCVCVWHPHMCDTRAYVCVRHHCVCILFTNTPLCVHSLLWVCTPDSLPSTCDSSVCIRHICLCARSCVWICVCVSVHACTPESLHICNIYLPVRVRALVWMCVYEAQAYMYVWLAAGQAAWPTHCVCVCACAHTCVGVRGCAHMRLAHIVLEISTCVWVYLKGRARIPEWLYTMSCVLFMGCVCVCLCMRLSHNCVWETQSCVKLSLVGRCMYVCLCRRHLCACERLTCEGHLLGCMWACILKPSCVWVTPMHLYIWLPLNGWDLVIKETDLYVCLWGNHVWPSCMCVAVCLCVSWLCLCTRDLLQGACKNQRLVWLTAPHARGSHHICATCCMVICTCGTHQ